MMPQSKITNNEFIHVENMGTVGVNVEKCKTISVCDDLELDLCDVYEQPKEQRPLDVNVQVARQNQGVNLDPSPRESTADLIEIASNHEEFQ